MKEERRQFFERVDGNQCRDYILSMDQHSEEHWPGGVKIMMTLESAEPKGKKRLGGKW